MGAGTAKMRLQMAHFMDVPALKPGGTPFMELQCGHVHCEAAAPACHTHTHRHRALQVSAAVRHDACNDASYRLNNTAWGHSYDANTPSVRATSELNDDKDQQTNEDDHGKHTQDGIHHCVASAAFALL